MQAIEERVEQLIFSRFAHEPTKGQIVACKSLVSFLYDSNPLSVFLLKGYAGTGKTTLISAFIQILPFLRLQSDRKSVV